MLLLLIISLIRIMFRIKYNNNKNWMNSKVSRWTLMTITNDYHACL